jgi:hypothetical protein
LETWANGAGEAGSGAEAAPPSLLNSSVQFRCPACRKLFAADPLDLLAGEPLFGCDSCGTEFVVPLPEGLAEAFAGFERAQAAAEPTVAPMTRLGAPQAPAVAGSTAMPPASVAAPALRSDSLPAAHAELAPRPVGARASSAAASGAPPQSSFAALPQSSFGALPLARTGDDLAISPRTRARVREMQGELATKSGAKLPLGSVVATWLPCPRCLKRNPQGSAECRSCGIVFAKWRPDERAEADIHLGGTIELARLWDSVLQSWDNEAAHMEFLASCGDQSRLPFASRKYGQILSVSPDDERARAMRGRIVKMASAGFEPRSEKPAIALRAPRATSIAIALSACVLFVGILAPGLRSMASVGACMLLASGGLRIWLRGAR